jgi:predicted RNase H-like HicB family nuclease
MELIFEVREAEEGGYVARALGQAIFTEAETWQELRDNVLEVTSLHFEDAPAKPKLIQLHFVPVRHFLFRQHCDLGRETSS